MAFPTSYVSGRTIRDSLSGTNVVNLSTANAIKVAVFKSITGADKNAVESYTSAPWTTTNECATSGTYTQGGSVVAVTVGTPSGGTWKVTPSVGTISWTGVTWASGSAPEGLLLFADLVSPKRVLAAVAFAGGEQPVTNGTFTITWDASNGLFYSTF